MTISIIICTRNRANSLDKTLESFNAVEVAAGLCPEIFVVDNGSTDHTAEVVRKHAAGKIPIRYLLESSTGLSVARNAGLAASSGEVILFTDDDVAPTEDWLERIATPLLRRECDGVAGTVELAVELRRPWMTPYHLVWAAVFHGEPLQLIGANMGFHRSVLEKVPAFDVELGAGASGFGEETLFSWQLVEAGHRLRFVPEASVVHRPDPSRFIRSSWLASSRKHGASTAYLMHHWHHEKIATPRLNYYYFALKLHARRLLQPPRGLDAEGIAPWEMSYVMEMEKCRRFTIEQRRPRNYSRRGLRKGGSPA